MKTAVSMITLILLCGASIQKGEYYSTKEGAIKGYDPVAYFLTGEPTKGNQSFSQKWKGATWYFATSENKKLFVENPGKYAPQYGGYCAYAVSQGYTAKVDPTAWKIVDGKLYLNYDQEVQATWESDQENFIKKANENWPVVKPN